MVDALEMWLVINLLFRYEYYIVAEMGSQKRRNV